MAMKKTDLEKNKALKLVGQMQKADIPGRFAQGAALPDKREQRRRDQELNLIPFAVKINQDVVKQVKALAEARAVPLNDLVEELLRTGLTAASQS